jgi:hypothetical protein
MCAADCAYDVGAVRVVSAPQRRHQRSGLLQLGSRAARLDCAPAEHDRQYTGKPEQHVSNPAAPRSSGAPVSRGASSTQHVAGYLLDQRAGAAGA